MSNHGSAPSGGKDSGSSSSRVQPSSIVNEGKRAKEEIQGNIFKYALFLFALLIIWNTKACYQKNKKDEAAKKAQVSAIQPTLPHATAIETLVLERKCSTPCSATVGWSYKIRTDGDPLDILYNGCSEWAHRPAKGDFQAPKCFKPGEAQFASPEGRDPHVDVWVYRKVVQ